jgi:hypothetical protein
MVVRRADGPVWLSSLRIRSLDGPGPARPQPSIHFYNWGLSNRDEFNIYENWTVRSLLSIYETLSSDRLKRLSPPSKKLCISKNFHRSSSLGQQFLFFPGGKIEHTVSLPIQRLTSFFISIVLRNK